MGSFKLGSMTLGSLFKKPETIQYPVQVKTPPAGLKGHIELDIERCILCSLCARRCPTHAIEVQKKDRLWSINRFSCVQCGSCVRECPKHCLSMNPAYAPCSREISTSTFTVPEQAKKAKTADETA